MEINNTNQLPPQVLPPVPPPVVPHHVSIRAIAVEIGILLLMVAIVLVTLNFLKVIDIVALFTTQSNTSQNPKSNITQNSNLNQVPAQRQSTPEPVKSQSEYTSFTRGVQSLLPYLNLSQLGENKSLRNAVLFVEFEGKIKKIDTTGGIDKASGLPYQLRLEFSIGTSGATTSTFYPQEAISSIKIYDSRKNEITLEDLKPGDSVTVKTSIGVIRRYPYNFYGVVITKL